jgi:hypothetical protein
LSRNKAREISQAPSSAPEKGDALAIEDARLASKIKNICRGC